MDEDETLSFPDAPRAELDRVLGELVGLAGGVLETQGRLRALLRANHAVVKQLELPVVLRRIVDVAVELVGAQYGALGVIAPYGGLEQFIHVGMSPHRVEVIGHLPEGHGLLGAVIDDPHPIRLRHLSDDSRSSGFPEGHPPMDSFLGVPVRVRDKVFGNLYLTNQRSGAFSADDEQLVVSLAETAGFAIDNARLFAESKRRQAWTTAASEITASLLASDDSMPLALLSSRVLALANANLVYVVLPAGDSDEFVIDTVCGAGGESMEGVRFPLSGSIVASVVEARQPRLLSEDAVREVAPIPGALSGPTLAVPLVAAGRILGALIVSRLPGSIPFASADLEIAADFAGRASVAMEVAKGREDRQRMLVLEDHNRIARDLHDHVIQQLFATGMELQNVIGALPPGPVAASVNTAVGNLDTAIAQIRTAIFKLADSPGGKDATVRHHIIDLVDDLGAALPQAPSLVFSGPVDLMIDGDLAGDVVAVVREALTNVIKHSQAQHVTVSLSVGGGQVQIDVTDDGVGITHGGRRSGLANLEARASKRTGAFSVSSDRGKTCIHWRVPLATGTG